MATYLWSALSDDQVINPFNRNNDVLQFDGGISAASLVVERVGTTTTFTLGDKTVTLQMPFFAITGTNVTFDNGSWLIVGDETSGVSDDDEGGTITGGALGDQLVAGPGGYLLFGLGGRDLLIGGADDDELDGGDGRDTMRGGRGDDEYTVGASNDVIVELPGLGQGNDLVTSSASYTLSENIERLLLVGPSVNGTGNSGDNLIFANSAANTLSGLAGDDFLEGFAGNDTLIGGTGADGLDGGEGYDFASYITATSGVTVDLSEDIPNTGVAVGDGYGSIEGLVGTEFPDFLHGEAADNTILGLGGKDTIVGGGGNDTLIGGPGLDYLDGHLGVDRLAGEGGSDTFYFETDESHGDVIVDFNGNGALAGDQMIFSGFGTAGEGARFIQLDATRWQITSGGDGELREVITFLNAAAIHPSDYTFM